MAVKSYRDLHAWQKGMDLMEETYRLSSSFPKNEEFGLKSQMRRAAVSIPSNIAEGHNRAYSREFLQFIYIAMGSLSELETQFHLAMRLKIMQSIYTENGLCLCREIGMMLYGLANAVRAKQQSHLRVPGD
jgi:four helix bundle protein